MNIDLKAHICSVFHQLFDQVDTHILVYIPVNKANENFCKLLDMFDIFDKLAHQLYNDVLVFNNIN